MFDGFLSQYRHTVDPKGRVTVPARYRELIGESAIITRGFDGNLMVMPEPAFESMAAQLSANTSITDPTARGLRRLLFASAERVAPDGNGRILIPNFLREQYNLTGEVVLSSSGDFFEIWAGDTWDEYEKSLLESDANQFIGQSISTSQE